VESFLEIPSLVTSLIDNGKIVIQRFLMVIEILNQDCNSEGEELEFAKKSK
jgi:hypothetical protein